MKLFYALMAINLVLLTQQSVASEKKIEYGYDYKGNYVPSKIEYGYDYRGNYVPKKIDGKKIEYGYDYRGNYVPKKIKEK